MVGKTPVVVLAVVAVVAAAALFGYTLLPASRQSTIATGAASTIQGSLQIKSASLSGGTMTLTVQDTGSQSLSIDALMLLVGTGCPPSALTTSVTAQASQNRSQFTRLSCMVGSTNFVVQSNGTVSQLRTPQFNLTSRTQSSFTRTLNSSRSGGFQGAGGLFGGGYQLAAGQSVTLTFSGAIGTQVTSGAQYTIDVVGQQARAQITLTAT